MKKLYLFVLLLLITSCVFSQESTKCGKFKIQLKNDCSWLLASRTKWVEGYVLIEKDSTEYFDVYGNIIDYSKVISYSDFPGRKSKKKCYRPISCKDYLNKNI